jgi:large subunit ribosomal protein L4
VLLVLSRDDVMAWKSFRNIPKVHVVETAELNTYDVLLSDVVVFTKSTLPITADAEAAK